MPQTSHSTASNLEPAGAPRTGRLSADDRRDLAALRRQFHAVGWHRKPSARLLWDLALLVLTTGVGLAVVVVSDSLFVDAAGLLVTTLGTAGVATHTHSSSHFATSSRRWVNQALTYFGYPFFVGLSASYWRHKHLTIHHHSPNVIGVDDDADLLPWFAMTQEDTRQGGPLARAYYRSVQGWIFPIALAVNGFNMQASGWRFVYRALASRERRSEHVLDLVSLLAHYAFWIALPIVWFPVTDVLIVYALRISLMGYAMFAILAPGHFPVEALRVRDGVPIDALALQTGATINFKTGWLGRLLCSGLEYQIEHHLFPDVSHVYLPAVSVAVREFCARRGLPYRCYPWPVAIWKSWKVMFRPGAVHHTMASLRWDA